MTKLDLDAIERMICDTSLGQPIAQALITRIRGLQAFLDSIPDAALETYKVYREQCAELFTDEDSAALYMDEARRRLLARGAVLP